MKNDCTGWTAFVAIVSASLFFSGCYVNIGGSSKERFEREVELSAPLGPDRKLVAKTSFGSISVLASDSDRCQVTAKIRANARTRAEAEEIAQKTKVSLTRKSYGLSLAVDKPRLSRNRHVGVSLVVRVPKSTELDCTSSFGSIDVEHIHADIKADTSFASITLNDVQGILDLHTSHGSIKGKQVAPAATQAKTSFANIDLDYQEPAAQSPLAEVRLETSHGPIKVDNLTAQSLSAKSSFASIDISCSHRCAPDLRAKVTTSHGGITFNTPPEYAGSVDMSTRFGSLNTDLPINVKGDTSENKLAGQIGEGSGRLQLRTQFGSIKLR